MFHLLHINPRYAALASRLQVHDFASIMARRDGRRIGEHYRRDVVRIEIDHDGRRQGAFLKREYRPYLWDLVANLLAGAGWATKARQEWQTLRALRAAGFGCPEPIAFGQRGLVQPRGFLVVAELRAGRPLQESLETLSAAARKDLVRALAREVARLHECGFNHPDLYAKHVWVAREDAQWRFTFLDLQRTRRRRWVSWNRRVRDLAALNGTVSGDRASRSDRWLFLRVYLESSGKAAGTRRLASRILWRSRRIAERRKTWRRALARAADRLMWLDRTHGGVLRDNGLDRFDAVMHGERGTLLRRLPHRENWRLELGTAEGNAGQTVYLKRHRTHGAAVLARAFLGRRPNPSPARIEAGNIVQISQEGVATMRLLAYGEKKVSIGCIESFLMTEELTGATPLDAFLRQRFPAGDQDNHRDPDLRALLHQVADLTRRFHGLGYNHRDLYCCHFFVREPTPGTFQLNLIDLQRVQRRRYFRRRWLVKDLSQLSYSAPPDVVGPRLRLAFLKRYLGVSRLGPRNKQFARRILAKHGWITRHGYPP